MKKQNSFKVRDKRNRGWFWVENEYFNGFGKILGAGAIAVYVSLCRHANNEQKCFPSQKTIAEETKLSERTVRNIIKQLEKHRIIEITKERSEDGKWLNNVYWLLDKSEWIYPEANNADGKPEANKDIAGGKIRQSQRQYVPLNNTNRNNTNNNNTNIDIVANATEPFSFEYKLEQLLSSKDKKLKIIGLYWKFTGIAFPSKEAFQAGLRRELRPAKNLIGYPLEQIISIFDYLDFIEKNEGWLEKWTLETVHKFIDRVNWVPRDSTLVENLKRSLEIKK